MAGLDGRAIRERRRLGVSQEELARAIGVSFATVNRWENGHTRPSKAAERLLRDFLQRVELEKALQPPLGEATDAEDRVRVLIVDDDEMVLNALRRTLEHYRHLFEISTAMDGYEAGVKTGTFRPDVVVLDIYLPGMNGFEVCRFLKSQPETAHIKVIAVTGYGTESTLREIREAGADAVLLKPIDVMHFLRVLHQLAGTKWKKADVGVSEHPKPAGFHSAG